MRRIGGTGLAVAPIGLDGGVFGWVSGSKEAAAMLDAFVGAGGGLVYTADHFAGGRSEVMIGSWLRSQRDTSGVVVATTIGQHADARGLSPRMVARATEASLRRLGTDRIDILTLDGHDSSVPIDDTLEAVDLLVRAGKVGHVAVLGHTAARVRAMQGRSAEARYPHVMGVFEEYSLMARGVFEREFAPFVEQTGTAFFALRPLAHRFLTGGVSGRADVADSPLWGRALDHVGRKGSRVLDRLAQVAQQLGASRARVAAAWAISKPGVTAAIVAARSTEELLDVLEARGLALTRQQMASLDDVSS
ncbi:aldo/keto reductase [Salinibacterium sp. SYSU T00001]|uniref:aldo/keto reductase n=1 Tax=Homoserinimonas sedimenticola TaxID=2986805 RepID=UPI00223630D6|nr:aldo/keto reductase [Salinibacterium sedimenticola]MCW4386750.1 aldo/keto reductase [Salinibacterium sedimenticola]